MGNSRESIYRIFKHYLQMTSCSSLKRKTVRTVIFWGLIYFMGIPAFSQTQLTPKLEIFAGAEFHYRDIFYNKMYEIVVNLAPGVKWHIGNQWQLSLIHI